MSEPGQLPYLIRLLDDETPSVRQAVERELQSFGPDLQEEITRQGISLEPHQSKLLTAIVDRGMMEWIRGAWPSWMEKEDEHDQLEGALRLIAEFQYRRHYPVSLEMLLDQLAEEYREVYEQTDVLQLSQFLFSYKEIKGAQIDYYNPLNSNLNYVIEKRRGIPISLSCIYMLVGKRLGLQIEGLNFPGHFLTRAHAGRKKFIVDCYNHGRHVDEKNIRLLSLSEMINRQLMALLTCDAETIVGRMLRNLIQAYRRANNPAYAELMDDLLAMMNKDRT